MSGIGIGGDDALVAEVGQGGFDVKGVVVVGPGFGAFHQGENDRRQILNHWGLGIVVGDRQGAARTQ